MMNYWQVEKKSACIYSQRKSVSSLEVTAMIERILRHCTAMSVDRNYVDFHGVCVHAFTGLPAVTGTVTHPYSSSGGAIFLTRSPLGTSTTPVFKPLGRTL